MLFFVCDGRLFEAVFCFVLLYSHVKCDWRGMMRGMARVVVRMGNVQF